MLLFVISPVLTVLTNPDPIYFTLTAIPGLRIHDSIAAVATQAIAILPFFLARRFLATEAAQREILVALVVAGLVYSVPMLIEVRLSPQINTWVYGFFQHDFIQMMRYGGFRPIVFLPHGLWAAFFALMALVAAVGLWRFGPPQRRASYMAAAGYLGVVLLLCKSAAVARLRGAAVAGRPTAVGPSADPDRGRAGAVRRALSAAARRRPGAGRLDRRAGGGRERRAGAARCSFASTTRTRCSPAPRNAAVRMGRLGPQPHPRSLLGRARQHHGRTLDHRDRHPRLVRLHRRVRSAGAAAADARAASCAACRRRDLALCRAARR